MSRAADAVDPWGATVDAGVRSPRWLRIAFPLLMVLIAVSMLGLPQLLRGLPDRPAIRIAGLDGQVSGAYVTAPNGLFKLFAYPERVRVFPTAAAITGGDTSIYIRSRQLDELSTYDLRSYPQYTSLPIERRVIDKHTIQLLTSGTLAPGEYCISASKDSVDAGLDYFYFKVSGQRTSHSVATQAAHE